ncbi:MAG: 16S rRNA (uracil(1498)-N(3))-methyltransferase [Verrucomicrobiota bacterium]
MHRFYVPSASHHQELTLPEREAHHAVNVLRIKEGERVVVLDGAGHEIMCQVRSCERGEVVLKVTQRHAIAPLPYELTLLQAITKGKTMDLIIQKATELGAHRIVPILSERTVAQVDAERAEHKIEKWEATAIEAIKQCGSAWLPKIETPMSTKDFLARGERFDLPLIATLQADSRHPREHFETYHAERSRRPKTIGVWVGPEGDYTPAEINAIRGSGALPITLGQLILRSETAAIYCLSVLNYEMQSPQAK